MNDETKRAHTRDDAHRMMATIRTVAGELSIIAERGQLALRDVGQRGGEVSRECEQKIRGAIALLDERIETVRSAVRAIEE